MKSTFTAGHVLDIPIRVNASWFVSLALSTGLLGARVYPDVLPGRPAIAYWSLALTTSLIFFASILLHELGHALVARYFGVPVRSITLFLLGGVAQITQEMKQPSAELLIAAAGPAVSILLSGFFLGLMLLTDFRHHPGPFAMMWTWLWLLNLSVGVFNLIPGFPMDGGRIFRSLIWSATGSYKWATRIAGGTGQVVALLLMALGAATIARVPGLSLGGGAFNGAWLILIGWYLNNAARQSLSVLRVLERLRAYRAEDAMLRDVPVVDSSASVMTFLPQILSSRDCEVAFVADYAADGLPKGGRLVGMVTRSSAVTVPERDRERVTARQLMVPAETLDPASPEDDGASLLQRLEGEGLVAVPVVSGGEVLGLVGRASLLHLLERRGRR